MRRGVARWVAVAIAAGSIIAGSSTPAAAYKRTQTCNSYGTFACKQDETPKPIAWPNRCVRYRIHEEGSSDFSRTNSGQIGDRLRELVTGAFETWNAASCTDFTMVEGPLTSNDDVEYTKEADWDENMNLVVWRDNQWPYGSMNAAFALTSVTYSSSSGRIADADIEINSAAYEFTSLDASKAGETGEVDLSNTLTHEVGHFLGLDHTDNEEATMYRSAPSGEVQKRTLHQDDINGLCAIYPGDEQSGTCEYPEDFKPPPPDEKEDRGNASCCTDGGSPFPKGSLVLGLSLFTLLRLRSRH